MARISLAVPRKVSLPAGIIPTTLTIFVRDHIQTQPTYTPQIELPAVVRLLKKNLSTLLSYTVTHGATVQQKTETFGIYATGSPGRINTEPRRGAIHSETNLPPTARRHGEKHPVQEGEREGLRLAGAQMK